MSSTKIRGLVLTGLAAASLGLAACGGSSHTTSSATPPSTARQLVSWYDSVKPDFQKLTSDFNSFHGTSADCTNMLADAQTLQDDPPAPEASVNKPWQAAMVTYARAGLDCSSGIDNNDDSLIKAAVDEVDAANSYLKQATDQLPT